MPTPRVLSIAGTDPTGGAGIQADLKSISANGGYGMAVVTALVAQNTHGVRSVHVPPLTFLREQLDAVSDDVTIDAVKIGMLGTRAITAVVQEWLQVTKPPIVVLDPVMIATSGDRLLDHDAEQAMRELLAHVEVVTPNLPELAVLLQDETAQSWADAIEQGRRLSAAHGVVVLVKGGHLGGDSAPDALVDAHGRLGPDEVFEISAARVPTSNTHGTGCSMSAALATQLAIHHDWRAALTHTKAWLMESIEHADELEVGSGAGPIHHYWGLWERQG